MKTSPLIRFFLSSDDDGHSYVIPVAHRADWVEWCNGDRETDVPQWAVAIDSPESISFADWSESDGDVDPTSAAPEPAAPKTRVISLTDLVGPHLLKGVDQPAADEHKLTDCIRFKLDDQVYEATRDEDDGWRSRMRDIAETDAEVTNTFRGVKVIGRMKTEQRDHQDYGSSWQVLQLVHAKTGKVILECGTNDSDDYYPSWEAGFWPEHLKA